MTDVCTISEGQDSPVHAPLGRLQLRYGTMAQILEGAVRVVVLTHPDPSAFGARRNGIRATPGSRGKLTVETRVDQGEHEQPMIYQKATAVSHAMLAFDIWPRGNLSTLLCSWPSFGDAGGRKSASAWRMLDFG